MFTESAKRVWSQVAAIAVMSMGLAQASYAGAIDTSYLIDTQDRASSLDRIELLLAKDSVATQLETFGVAPSAIDARLAAMTTAELIAFEQRLTTDVAGGDAVGIIGTVFIVLIVLELVGVTDIFKAF